VGVAWCVTAGWALELFRGEQTRDHEDLDIAVSADCFDALRRALGEFELFVVGEGVARAMTADALAAYHQTWVRDPASGKWRVDIFREPWERDTWVYRRDPRIRMPISDALGYTSDGIPYMQPEIVLLFKAKRPGPKDEADFAALLPLLDASKRGWLTEVLGLVHPGHRWLSALT
jgi:hypothetical protein